MSEIKELIEDIEKLREQLYKLSDQKQNTLDPDVLAASRQLNAAIVKYNELLTKKLNNK